MSFLDDIFLGWDVQDFLFYQVLRIDPSSSLITGDIGRDLLFVLVIPSLVGLMVLRSISTVVLQGHGHLKSLFSLAALGMIIYMGLYTILAQFSVFIFMIWIFVFGGLWGYKAIVGKRMHGALLSGSSLIGNKIKSRIKDKTLQIHFGTDEKKELNPIITGMISAAMELADIDEQLGRAPAAPTTLGPARDPYDVLSEKRARAEDRFFEKTGRLSDTIEVYKDDVRKYIQSQVESRLRGTCAGAPPTSNVVAHATYAKNKINTSLDLGAFNISYP